MHSQFLLLNTFDEFFVHLHRMLKMFKNQICYSYVLQRLNKGFQGLLLRKNEVTLGETQELRFKSE